MTPRWQCPLCSFIPCIDPKTLSVKDGTTWEMMLKDFCMHWRMWHAKHVFATSTTSPSHFSCACGVELMTVRGMELHLINICKEENLQDHMMTGKVLDVLDGLGGK